MKITHRHRHISESEHQPGISVQTHDAPFLSPKNATGNTEFFASSEDSPPKAGSSARYCKAWIHTDR